MDSQHPSTHRPGAASERGATRARRTPGRQSPTQTRQRNQELLKTALDLFLEKGFERTSIDEIAAAVGMAKRTIYLRYGNKTKLFKASLQRAIEEWIIPVERLRAAETDDLEQTLLRIGQIQLANVLSPAGLRLLRITNAESARMPEIGAFTCQQGTNPTLAYIEDLIRRRARRPDGTEVDDPHEAALAFLELVVGGPANYVAWGIEYEQQEIDRHTQYCVRLFLHGLLHGHDAAAQNLLRQRALEEDNRRLKLLLAEALLETNALRDKARAP